MTKPMEFKEDGVQGYLHQSESGGDAIVLTHGAGANCQSQLLIALAEAFCEAGVTVLRCDLPFRQVRPHGPPMRGSGERDQAGLRAALEAIRRDHTGRIFLGGHSYGGRQASMLCAAEPGLAEGLLLLSYPLHPPEKPDQLRTAHFPALQTPGLFVSGEKDGFGTLSELEAALRIVPVRTELMMVPGAGHELMTAKTRGELPEKIVNAFLRFVGGVATRE